MAMDPGISGEDYSAVLFSDMTEEPSDKLPAPLKVNYIQVENSTTRCQFSRF